jgi:hypothetical protein
MLGSPRDLPRRDAPHCIDRDAVSAAITRTPRPSFLRSTACIAASTSAPIFGRPSRLPSFLARRRPAQAQSFQKPLNRSDLALYSITSSARASSTGGISKPSAFSVLRFVASLLGWRLYWQFARPFALQMRST